MLSDIPTGAVGSTTNIRYTFTFNVEQCCPHSFQYPAGAAMERFVHKLDFECNVCKKQFNKRHSLKIHIDRVHEKKLDHECLVCQKRFFYMKDLINHLKVHNKIEKPPLEYLPEDSRDELTKEGRVFVKGFEITIDLICMFCFKILGTAASAKYHQKLHLDGKKHKQLMESAAFQLEQEKLFSKSSQKENKTEVVKKDDQGMDMPISEQDFKVTSEKNDLENSGTNFFFSCQKCFHKFLSTRQLRNHTCGDQPLNEPASTETKERIKKSNKLTITRYPPNKETKKSIKRPKERSRSHKKGRKKTKTKNTHNKF